MPQSWQRILHISKCKRLCSWPKHSILAHLQGVVGHLPSGNSAWKPRVEKELKRIIAILSKLKVLEKC